MAIVAQLLGDDDLLALTQDKIDVLELVVFREIVNNPEVMSRLGERVGQAAAVINKSGGAGWGGSSSSGSGQ